MIVGTADQMPDCDIRMTDANSVRVRERTAEAETVVEIDLSPGRPGAAPLLEVRCQPKGADVERLSVQ